MGNSNQNALEEARTLLEQADRARRMVEQELADTNESLSDQTCTNQAIQGAKMKIESEMGTLSADLDEMSSEASMSEEKAQRAMIDAARLADELRGEQDCAQGLERERKLLEAQVKDMQARVDDAQSQALKGGKKAMSKMDTRSRLRRPRRSPPSTLPSTGRPRTMWLMLATALKPRSRLSPRTALGLAAHPLGRCKKLKLKKKSSWPEPELPLYVYTLSKS